MNKQPLQLVYADSNDNYVTNTVSWSQLKSIDWQHVSFITLDAFDLDRAFQMLQKIRQHESADVYLRPVVFILPDEPHTWLAHSADTYVVAQNNNEINWQACQEQLESINLWIDNLATKGEAPDSQLAIKVLRMIASRKGAAEPIATSDIKNGFIYPKLQALFTLQDQGAFQMLQFLEQQKLVSPTLVDRAHFCIHCDSAFLNFKEICSACQSHDLEVLELIHHFKCAHTADILQFKKPDGSLVCPKCDGYLRHIGVDYDKPSTVNKCQVCGHVGQDSEVIAQCYQCNRKMPSELLEIRRINEYTITSVGLNAAYYGLTTYFTNILKSEMQLLSLKEFELFVEVESARITRYKKSESSIALVRFNELESIYLQLGTKAKDVFAELALIFKAVFRESDVITAYNESIFVILMTETSKHNAELALSRLSDSAKQLFTENFNSEHNMIADAIAINGEVDVKKILEAFLDK